MLVMEHSRKLPALPLFGPGEVEGHLPELLVASFQLGGALAHPFFQRVVERPELLLGPLERFP